STTRSGRLRTGRGSDRGAQTRWSDRDRRDASARPRRAFRGSAARAGERPSRMIAALRKEFLLQWRTRAQAVAVFVFGATSLLLFSFAIGPSAALRQYAGGFLWLGLLLSSTLTLSEAFHAEMENHALEGLLLLPVSAPVLYYS